MYRFARHFLVLLAFSLALPLAHAAILGNGDTGPPSFLTPTGTLLISVSGTITTPTFSTDYTQWVYRDPNNTFLCDLSGLRVQFHQQRPRCKRTFHRFRL